MFLGCYGFVSHLARKQDDKNDMARERRDVLSGEAPDLPHGRDAP